MAKKTTTTPEVKVVGHDDSGLPQEARRTPDGMRRCIGSTTFGIEAHDAPVIDFPVQPSQKDGLGRLCKPHWKEYVTALRKRALERKAAEAATEPTVQSEAAARVATKRAARVAAKAAEHTEAVPAAGESPGPKARRAKLEARLAKVGVESDEGQRVLEAAGVDESRGRKPMAEAVIDPATFD
jgi:hypothetical protein